MALVRNLIQFNTTVFPPGSEYALPSLSFMIHNMDKFEPSSEIPNINRTHKHYLHVLTANCSSHVRDVYLARIKLYDAIPSNIKIFN